MHGHWPTQTGIRQRSLLLGRRGSPECSSAHNSTTGNGRGWQDAIDNGSWWRLYCRSMPYLDGGSSVGECCCFSRGGSTLRRLSFTRDTCNAPTPSTRLKPLRSRWVASLVGRFGVRSVSWFSIEKGSGKSRTRIHSLDRFHFCRDTDDTTDLSLIEPHINS